MAGAPDSWEQEYDASAQQGYAQQAQYGMQGYPGYPQQGYPQGYPQGAYPQQGYPGYPQGYPQQQQQQQQYAYQQQQQQYAYAQQQQQAGRGYAAPGAQAQGGWGQPAAAQQQQVQQPAGAYRAPGQQQQPQQQAARGGYVAPGASAPQQQQQPPQQQQQRAPQQQPQAQPPAPAQTGGKSAVPGKLQPRAAAPPAGKGGATAVPGKLAPRQVAAPDMGMQKGKKAQGGKVMSIPAPQAAQAPAADKEKAPEEEAAKPKPKGGVVSLGGAKKADPAPEAAAPAASAAAAAPAADKEKEPASPADGPSEDAAVVPKAKPKKKKREFVRDPRPHLNVVFIGHVDAGKSTISGHLMVLHGGIDERTLEQFEQISKQKGREGWHFAYAFDVDEQEREKGKTHETGSMYFETPDRRYTILDAPGHKAFVPSMIGGAAQADVAVLVISARRGEFETGFERGGQTREHALLVKTTGVRFLAIGINKMDDPTVEWSKERYDEIVGKLTPFLKGSGWAKGSYEFFPLSGLKGVGIKDPVSPEICPWITPEMRSLCAVLNTVQVPGRKEDDPARFPIMGRYKSEGKLAVHGKLESGTLTVNDEVLLQPSKRKAVIDGMTLDEAVVQTAIAGDNLLIRLRGVEEEDVHNGYVLTDPAEPLTNTWYFHAKVMVLEVKNIISSGFTCIMHAHALAEEITFDELLATLDKKTGKIKEKHPHFVKANDQVMVRMCSQNPICVEEFTVFDRMGRFMLRDEGKTIAVGVITKLLPDRKPGSAAEGA